MVVTFSLHWPRHPHCSKVWVLYNGRLPPNPRHLYQSQFELAKKSYLKRIKRAVVDDKIPAELVINWDQTGVNVVPASQWTQEEKGSSRVEVAGVGDKAPN